MEIPNDHSKLIKLDHNELIKDSTGHYTCIKCNFQTKQKNDYRRHIKSKKHGKEIIKINA